LLASGVGIVVLTKDRGGSVVYTGDERIDVPLVFADKVVDTTGSGDTYMIGFLVEYGRTQDLWRAGIFAATCASFNLESIGPYDMPSRVQVEDRMEPYL
jgi:sugar/nucleoside kinase (ribokinase family)